jgi:hypothetical protein
MRFISVAISVMCRIEEVEKGGGGRGWSGGGISAAEMR